MESTMYSTYNAEWIKFANYHHEICADGHTFSNAWLLHFSASSNTRTLLVAFLSYDKTISLEG